jgi:diadenylate cyclase
MDFLKQFLGQFDWVAVSNLLLKGVLEIAVISFCVYRIITFVKGTRAVQLVKGIAVIFLLAFITKIFGLSNLNLILKGILVIMPVGILIVFQPEIRRGLARLGQRALFSFQTREEQAIDEIIKAVSFLSRNKIGALIAIARDTGLGGYKETGVAIDAQISSELIVTIFTPRTPLHDGAIIIHEEHIVAASCILPVVDILADSEGVLGTRHRAALGITEETDAIAIVVSEETGHISLAIKGKLSSGLDALNLRDALLKVYPRERRKSIFLKRVKNEK